MYYPFKEEKVYTIKEIKELAKVRNPFKEYGELQFIYKKEDELKVLYGTRENFTRIVFEGYNEYKNLYKVSHTERTDSVFGDIYEEPFAYEVIN